MTRVGEGPLGGMEPFELAPFKDVDVSPFILLSFSIQTDANFSATTTPSARTL